MKKSIIVLFLLFVSSFAFSLELHLKSTDNVSIKDMLKYDVIIKEADDNYVKVIIKKGKDFEYPHIEIINSQKYKENYYLQAKYKDKYGCIDRFGKILVPFIYDEIVMYTGSKYVVSENVAELTDKQGNVVVPKIYYLLEIIKDKYLIIKSEPNSKFGLKDFKNNLLIPFEYDSILYIDDNFICANNYLYLINGLNTKNKKSEGYILDIHNNIIKKYDRNITPLLAYSDNKDHREVYCKDIFISGNELIDIDGNVIHKSDKSNSFNPCKAGIICKDQSKTFVYNYNGKEIYKGCELQIYGAGENCFVVTNTESKKCGLIDNEGNEILGFNYEKCIRPKEINTNDECKYLAFVNKDKSILVNLETFEKTEINKEIAELANHGTVYVKEPIDLGWRIVSYDVNKF